MQMLNWSHETGRNLHRLVAVFTPSRLTYAFIKPAPDK